MGELGPAGAPVLLLLHFGGGGFGTRGWEPLDELAQGDDALHLIRIDRLGYGLSDPRPHGFPPEFFEHDLEDLAEAVDLLLPDRTFRIAGTSDGGTLALMYAAAFPDRVKGLAVDGAHFRAEAMMRQSLDEMEQAFVARHGTDGSRDEPTTATLRAWFGGWRGLVASGWSIEARLARISCPVHVLQGSLDGVVPDEHAFALARACGGPSQAEILPGGGHLCQRSHPGEWLLWLQAMLAASSPR